MVHVTEKNVALIDVDLLIHECIGSAEGKNSFAYIVSPFLADFALSPTWLSFVSNVIDVSDIDRYVDLIALLRQHGVDVRVVTRSPNDLEGMTLSRNFIARQAKTLSQLAELGCEIRTNSSLHAKATVTARGVLSGSFNLTKSGRVFNIEAGFYFPNTSGMEKREYDDKLAWVKKVFDSSTPLNKTALSEWK